LPAEIRILEEQPSQSEEDRKVFVDPLVREKVLAYLKASQETNPQAEVSGQELSLELGINKEVVRECVEELVRDGLVDADLFPVNIWVRLTGHAPGFE
jgi:hypothetical protein